MPLFLDPTGKSNYGLGICARCQRKMFLEDLHSDPNTPGLKVCIDDLDDYDPYRLAPRQADRITLPFYRPDQDLGNELNGNPTSILLFARFTSGTQPRETQDGQIRDIEQALHQGTPPWFLDPPVFYDEPPQFGGT